MKRMAKWDNRIVLGDAPNPENSYFKKLKVSNPDDYEELRGNCYSFDSYVEARFK